MSKRTFKANIQYTTSYGFNTATGMHADNLKQAIGLCRWYATEIDRIGGKIDKAEAIICNEWGIELKSITVLEAAA